MSMYVNPQIQFRDPFSNDIYETPSKESWAYSQYGDFDRALTPPPDMNGTSLSSKSDYYHHQEHGQHYGDYMPNQQTIRAPASSYYPQEISSTDFGRYGTISQPTSRPMSPITMARQQPHDQLQQQQSHQRRESQTSSIAPSFQIPKSVNDSGGSLSELAAQITCLFWFESSTLLQQIEDSMIPLQPPRKLVSDAKPTTGFRKWVTTILSTTLVAQNVVLLALLFIYRLKKLNPSVRGKPGSEYRLLTVALMLGNKFLDDNTYTNKTWAEVSGINVSEVHIMEVEFLSNMKYNLYTSAEDWAEWQTLLGKFASFVERASRPQPPAPILPPTSSLHLPVALPSPPASNQASPPYVNDFGQGGLSFGGNGQLGPTPAPSPLAPMLNAGAQNSRKRSLDDYTTEPPAKRLASSHNYGSPHYQASGPAQATQNQLAPRLTLPSLSIPSSQAPSGSYVAPTSQTQPQPQLPPLNFPARAMGMVYPSISSHAQIPQIAAFAGPSSQPQSQAHSQYQSRQQSPYAFPGSTTGSPAGGISHSATPMMQPHPQVSPTYFLQHRNSPYRPVHNVSTLLYPPPSAALQQRPPSIEFNQMHYQPLGKPIQQQQQGRLPYVSQNVRFDYNGQQAMTPVHQWPFMNPPHYPTTQA